MILEGTYAIHSTGVDYLTATAAADAKRAVLRAIGARLVRQEKERGNDIKPWLWQGYTGEAAGAAAHGERPDSAIIRISSALAQSAVAAVATAADNVSRLDLQVTVLIPDSTANVAVELFDWFRRQPPRRGRPINASIVVGHPSGQTCYIGSRRSDYFFRLYDKHAESLGEYPSGAWRLELELKGDAAKRAAAAYLSARRGRRFAASYVAAWLRRQGIPVPYNDDGAIVVEAPPQPLSDTARRMEYLRRYVAPTVQKVLREVPRRQVLLALGLD